MITPQPMDTRDQIGPYRIVKAIGAGGSARVDLARIDRAYNFQRHVVIKRPLEHLRADPKAAASLRREAHIGARLRHPNLVGVLDAGTHDGYDYLVLEYVHGGALRTLLQADSPARVRELPLGAALSIAYDVARGLHAAHELTDEHGAPLGLVHRDVSPGNILVGIDGAVKLTDFGIAKETRVQTLSGSMHGTVTYMAPEQCRGHAFDRRADIFSLGVILYELVTGHRLFWADNDVASLHRVLSGNVPRPRKLRPALSSALEEIVMTAVAHEQDRRFATARDLADAIAHHAAEAGELLAARDIARWVHDVLGPRDEPWIGTETMVDIPRAPTGDDDDDDDAASLVELIAQVPADEPPNPTFGPTAPSFSDEVDTSPRRASPARPKRAMLATVIALALGGGAAATALVMMRGNEPPVMPAADVTDPPALRDARGAQTATENEQPIADPRDHAEVAADAGADTASSDATATAGDPASDRTTKGPRSRDRIRAKTRKPPPTEDAAANREAEKPPPASTGSQTRPAKVEWTPDMLLPTDPGSGTKKK